MPTLTLPRPPLEATLVLTPEDNVFEFKGDSGSGIRRQQYTGQRIIYTFEVQCHTKEEKDDLIEFYMNDCGGGSLRFDMEDVDDLGNSPPSVEEFSWVSALSARRIAPSEGGGIYVVSFNIAKEP